MLPFGPIRSGSQFLAQVRQLNVSLFLRAKQNISRRESLLKLLTAGEITKVVSKQLDTRMKLAQSFRDGIVQKSEEYARAVSM